MIVFKDNADPSISAITFEHRDPFYFFVKWNHVCECLHVQDGDAVNRLPDIQPVASLPILSHTSWYGYV